MATATKTVKYEGSWAIQNNAQVNENVKTIKDTSQQVSEVISASPMVIPGGSTNVSLPFGGVSLAKRVFLRTDQEVTLKIGQSTDQGFKFGPGDGTLPSTSGIGAIFITTGPNDTSVEFVISGD